MRARALPLLALGLLQTLPFPLLAEPPAKAGARLEDEAMAERARQALQGGSEAFQRETLNLLNSHRFRSSKSPSREYCLYAQGLLEDRFGRTGAAAAVLRKLELGFSKSLYLPEAQVVLASEAVDQQRYKEAEGRLRKALGADLPIIGRRRAQDLLLWCLVKEGRAAEAMPITQELVPLGTRKPSEKGLAALAVVLCQGENRSQADAAVKDYQRQFRDGANTGLVLLAHGRFLGASGDARGSAEELRKVIRLYPKSGEADEARLALATLLSEGKLPSRMSRNLPDPAELLKEMTARGTDTPQGRQRELIRMRLAVREQNWRNALDIGRGLEKAKPSDQERTAMVELQSQALQGWTQKIGQTREATALLPYLTPELVPTLAPDARRTLCMTLASKGLPQAARQVIRMAPASEQKALEALLLQNLDAGVFSEDALALLPPKGGDGSARLKQAQALAARNDWKALPAALSGATPGGARMEVLLSYLRRPLDKGETQALRRKDAETWLARAKEKAGDREPLQVLVADLRAQSGDWRGALALYPEKPTRSQGWVALQRANACFRLGQKDRARALLQGAKDYPDFKSERQTLGRQLGL